MMKNLDFLYSLFITLFPGALIFFCCSIGIYFFQKEKIYRYTGNGWLDVKEYPIPDDARNFIVTDGKNVDCQYSIKWSPHGKIYFSEYQKTFVTHWQPLPDVPKE